jgi:hypothetical protein
MRESYILSVFLVDPMNLLEAISIWDILKMYNVIS